MRKALVVLLVFVAIVTGGIAAHEVTLTWDKNCDLNVVGYNMYYGVAITPIVTNIYPAATNDCGDFSPASTNVYYTYTNKLQVMGRTNNVIVISNLLSGVKYSFTVTCFIPENNESVYSVPVTYTVPMETNELPKTLPSAVQNFELLKVQ